MRLPALVLCALVSFAVLALGATAADAQAQATRVDHAGQGRAAFESGHYREALDHFQRAYEATGAPILLYNIGQAADRLRLDATTLFAFQLYLERYPDAPNRDEVRHRVDALEPLVDLQAKALAAEQLKPVVDTRRVTVDVSETLMPSPYKGSTSDDAYAAAPYRKDARRDDRELVHNPWFWVAVGAVTVASVFVFAAAASQ